LTKFIADFKSLKPLKNAALFASVAIEEWGSGLTWDDEGPLSIAATTLGMSRRNVISYRTASRPIPKVVKLACKAVDMGCSAAP